jgi:hypothetical protein
MIMMEDLVEFGFGNATSLLKKFAVSQWGDEIYFQCLYEPGIESPYEIQLTACSRMSWSAHSPENIPEALLSITDITIKNLEGDLKEFVMLTEVFELCVTCKFISISKT